jgi:tetratricopeptide (TPR) repeat protein
VRYVGHFLWPRDLAYFYPHPYLTGPRASPWNGAALLALAGVLGASLAALALRRRLPAFFVGWSWFLGMLVPVIGIVQVGEQALADRYGYLTLVGLQLALVFALAELADRRARLRVPLGAVAVIAFLACGLASARQARTWKDSETLYRHALAATDENYQAWASLANELADRGDTDGARRGYEAALAIHPSYAPALYGFGLLEQQHGDPARALELYRHATEALPGFAPAHLNLGSLLAQDGETVAAAQEFERVLELDPEHPDAHYDLALLLFLHGQMDTARPHLEAAVRARPDYAAAWEKLGEVHEALGEHGSAIEALEHALADPDRIEAARLLAWILATASEPELRDAPRALELARRAVQATQRREPRALEALAAAQAGVGELERASQIQAEALELLPPGQQAEGRERLALYRRGETFQHSH